MRSLAAAALFVVFGAQAQLVSIPSVNLDKPGALAALAQDRPDHYRAVLRAVEKAQGQCRVKPGMQRAEDQKGSCQNHMIQTVYPGKILLNVPVDRTFYVLTIRLDPSLDRLTPAQ